MSTDPPVSGGTSSPHDGPAATSLGGQQYEPPTTEGATTTNCTPRVESEFPVHLFTDAQLREGMILVVILVCFYTFISLAAVCRDYFVPALERITHALGLEANVAGATIMAGGASFPQLATSVIAVFYVKSDIGVGTIVGSAFFNVLLVLGICGLAAPVIVVHWWPMMRDTFAYIISVVVLAVVLLDDTVHWYEGLVMVLFYILYITLLLFNKPLLSITSSAIHWFKSNCCCCPEGVCVRCQPETEPNESSQLMANMTSDMSRTDVKADDNAKQKGTDTKTSDTDPVSPFHPTDEEPYRSLMHPPSSGKCKLLLWVLLLPALAPVFVIVPDCRRPGFWRKLYPLTFLMSIVMIGCASYILVWMLTIIGETLGLPAALVGMTFLAAGDSIPDLLNAVFVAQRGYGDMAMSNCIGSNIFDLLVCLGLPWFLDTTTAEIGQVITINEDMTYISLCLLASAFIVYALIYLNNWQLDRKIGVIFIATYIGFTLGNSLYDVKNSPPPCSE